MIWFSFFNMVRRCGLKKWYAPFNPAKMDQIQLGYCLSKSYHSAIKKIKKKLFPLLECFQIKQEGTHLGHTNLIHFPNHLSKWESNNIYYPNQKTLTQCIGKTMLLGALETWICSVGIWETSASFPPSHVCGALFSSHSFYSTDKSSPGSALLRHAA